MAAPEESVVHGSTARPQDLPSVDQLLRLAVPGALLAEHGRTLVVKEARALLEGLRAQAVAGKLMAAEVQHDALGNALAARLQTRLAPRMKAVLNLTGTVIHTNLGRALLADLGDGEAVIFRNHGALVVGRSVGEAFNWMHRLELACRAQIGAMSCNSPLKAVPQEVLEETWNNYQPGTRRPYGLMEWPALLRKLDRMDPGFRD